MKALFQLFCAISFIQVWAAIDNFSIFNVLKNINEEYRLTDDH